MWHRTIEASRSGSIARLPLESVASLFEQLPATDSSALPAAVLRLIRPVLPAYHCAIFSFRPDQPPRLECEASVSPRAPLPPEVGLAYARRFYRFDSLAMFIARLRPDRGDLSLFEQSRSDIVDRDYLQSCYGRCNVIDRLSIVVPMSDNVCGQAYWLAVNLYRVVGSEPFLERNSEEAHGVLTVLGAAVKAKYRLSNRPCMRTMNETGVRKLSARESQVAELVAAGCTSKQIARRLGLRSSTITTLRKRAYEKLGAANGNALSARWAALNSLGVCPQSWGQTRTAGSN